MTYRGCERSVITYSSLISACEKAGQWELALELFREQCREQCTPNTVTYNSLITALAQGGWCLLPPPPLLLLLLPLLRGCCLVARGCTVLCTVGAHQHEPTHPAHNQTCSHSHSDPHSSSLAHHMPTHSTTTTLHAGAQREKASEVFEQMQAQGCRPI